MAKCVLIIEDDSDTAEMLGYLAEMLHFDVICSSDSLPVTEVIILNPNLILLDHNLRGRSGGELCRALKSESQTKQIPIILISAIHNLDQIARANGADHFITKPFDIDELQRAIVYYIS